MEALIVYLILMIGGFAFLFIMFLMGGFGEMELGGDGSVGDAGAHDVTHADSGSDGVHLSPMSPTLISMAIAFVGIFGIVLTVALPSYSVWLVGVLAIVAALVAAGLVFYMLLRFLANAQASSMTKLRELVGQSAEVTVKIPKGGFGTVDYESRGQRQTSSARADDEIAQGEIVVIEKIINNVMYVKKVEKKQ